MGSDVERHILQFDFTILQAEFNYTGQFYLQLSVCSSFAQFMGNTDIYSRIQLIKNDGGDVTFRHMVTTEPVLVEYNGEKIYFNENKYSFILPKGFCKNDNAHDVHLLVEAYRPIQAAPRRVGEARFAIYPRTNEPKVKATARIGEPMYEAKGYLPLLRTASTDNVLMHCGRLSYTASLKKIALLQGSLDTTPRSQVNPRKAEPEPTVNNQLFNGAGRLSALSSSDGRTPFNQEEDVLMPSVSPSIPESATTSFQNGTTMKDPVYNSRGQKVLESPSVDINKYTTSLYPGYSHVAPQGMEEVIVVCHRASNLSTAQTDLRAPRTFVSLNTSSRERQGIKAPHSTHPSLKASRYPVWEEPLAMQIDGNQGNEDVVLKVVDSNSKECLELYCIPIKYLQPFHHYHLELVMEHHTSRLFVTILRKTSSLPMEESNYYALEVLLQGVQQPLLSECGKLIALSKVVSSQQEYIEYISAGMGRHLGTNLNTVTVTFPDPHPSSFKVPSQLTQGLAQVTLPAGPPSQPEWNHTFLFADSRDKASLFSPGSAVVFEYYQASAAVDNGSWQLPRPLGYSVLTLDTNVYDQLVSDQGKMGIIVDKLPVQGSMLLSRFFGKLTVGLVIKLVTEPNGDSLFNAGHLDTIPKLYMPETPPLYDRAVSDVAQFSSANSSPSPPATSQPVKARVLPSKAKPKMQPIKEQEGQLPSHDAVEGVLPDYQYIFVDPDAKYPRPAQAVGGEPQLVGDPEKGSMALLDYQMRELEKYRTAVHKMGEDILSLRQQIRQLEAQNSQLRRDLGHYNDTTRMLMDSQELDGLTKPELAARYVAVKQKLTNQTSELKDYKERIQKLQNELIKKNDREKQFLEMSQAHKQQNQLVQNLSDKAQKVKQLEDNVRKQEKVIQRLEKIALKEGSGNSNSANEALVEENKRLRSELEDARSNKSKSYDEDDEKLELYEKLEKAEARVMSLERQLTEDARAWAREKSDLMLRLQHTERGFHTPPIGYRPIDPIPSPRTSQHYYTRGKPLYGSQKVPPGHYRR